MLNADVGGIQRRVRHTIGEICMLITLHRAGKQLAGKSVNLCSAKGPPPNAEFQQYMHAHSATSRTSKSGKTRLQISQDQFSGATSCLLTTMVSSIVTMTKAFFAIFWHFFHEIR